MLMCIRGSRFAGLALKLKELTARCKEQWFPFRCQPIVEIVGIEHIASFEESTDPFHRFAGSVLLGDINGSPFG